MVDELLKLQVRGASPKQIMQILNLPERTYYEYNTRLKNRIINEQLAKRHEEILVDKQIVKERLIKAMMIEDRIMTNEKISPRTRMDAGTRYAEISVAIFKLEAETIGFIHGLSTLRQQQSEVIRLPEEVRDERDSTIETEGIVTDEMPDLQVEDIDANV